MEDLSVNCKKASISDIISLYAYVIKLCLQKKNRDYSLIDEEYNSGMWDRPFKEIDFETLGGNYNRSDMNELNISPILDKLVKISRRDYDVKRQAEFLSFFKSYTQDSIVELGCGLGANLFLLHNSGFQNIAGYDLSINAINNLKKYTKMKGININFDACDLGNVLPKNSINGKIAFTYTCLEQCKHIMPKVLQNILHGEPKLVMNFEVDYDSSPYMVRKYFDARDYQNNFVRELKKLEQEDKIKILSIQKLVYSGTPVNRCSAIIWEPKS